MSERILPGAEPFRFDGGPAGLLLLHGFTGSPASLRPMGEWMAERGVAVEGPRLPGHGTTIEDLAGASSRDWVQGAADALDALASRCDGVVVAGLSMGGTLALHLAVTRPERIRGVVAINPYVRDRRLGIVPVARLVLRTYRGVGNDIKKPGQDEVCYPRIPVAALAAVSDLLRMVDAELPSMRLPLLVFSSTVDHTIDPSNAARVIARAGAERKEVVRLTNSYHVATLDYDAEALFERTLAFVRSLTGGAPS